MRPGSSPPPTEQPPRPPADQVGIRRPILAGGLASLLVAGIVAAASVVSSSLDDDPDPVPPAAAATPPALPSPGDATSEPASPPPSTPEDPPYDPCLIGTWQETSHETNTMIEGVPVRLQSQGAIHSFSPDGKLTVDYGQGITASGKAGNRTYEVVTSGTLTYDWRTSHSEIHYNNAQANGTVVWRHNGAETSRTPLIGNATPERYSCSANRMHQFGPAWTWGPTRQIKLQRIA